MDPDDLLFFTGHKSERICFTKILLLGKRQIQEILNTADVVYARLFEAFSVEIVRRDQTPDLMIYGSDDLPVPTVFH